MKKWANISTIGGGVAERPSAAVRAQGVTGERP